MEEKKEKCSKCGSDEFLEYPTTIEHDDGTEEENLDTLQAECKKCGNEWLVVYI